MIILREFIISVINKVQLSRITLAANVEVCEHTSLWHLPTELHKLVFFSSGIYSKTIKNLSKIHTEASSSIWNSSSSFILHYSFKNLPSRKVLT